LARPRRVKRPRRHRETHGSIRDRRYYYLPPIALKTKDGILQISASADGEITLPVVWDRPETRRIFREHLLQHNLLDHEANEGQIQVVTARAIRVETPAGYIPRIVFGPRENFEFTNFEGILTANASPALAQKFIEDLKKGGLELTVVIALEGYDFEQNVATITFEDIAETRYFKNLIGAGGTGLISRHQMANVAYEAATSRDIALTTEFDDPDFRQLVTDLLVSLEKKTEEFKNSWASVNDFFTREGWDPEDFRADLITRSKLDRNSEYATKFREELRSVATDKRKGGGFSLGLFGANIIDTDNKGEDEKYREWVRNVTREVLDKWSMKSEEEGKRLIPKSVTAYRNDFSQLRAKGAFRIGQRKKFRSEAIKTLAIHPLYNILQSPAKMPFEVRQAELANQVEIMKSQLAALESRAFPTDRLRLTASATNELHIHNKPATLQGMELKFSAKEKRPRSAVVIFKAGGVQPSVRSTQPGPGGIPVPRHDARCILRLMVDGKQQAVTHLEFHPRWGRKSTRIERRLYRVALGEYPGR